MTGDGIIKLFLVGLCTVGLGSFVIAGSVAWKELEKQRERTQHDSIER